MLARILDRSEALPDAARALVLGGKKLRSRILFAAAPPVLGAREEELLLEAGAAIELLHAGSLVHDDVIDRCALRRGLPTLHVVHGERTAAWAGTWVMYAATASVVDLPAEARRRFAGTARAVGRGQVAEIVRAHDATLGVEERLEIMEAKTASVFGLACEIGGIVGGLPTEVTRSLAEIGRSFGLVFQLIDDLDDLLAPASQLGRPPGTDVREGVLSLPLLAAVEAAGPGCLPDLLASAAKASDARAAARFRGLLRIHGALERTRSIARDLRVRAADEARAVRTRGGGHAGIAWILELLDGMVERIESRMEVAHEEG